MVEATSTEDIRFGRTAVEMRLATPGQVAASIHKQREYLAAGQDAPLLAQIMIALGFLTEHQARVVAARVPPYEPPPPAPEDEAGAEEPGGGDQLEPAVAVQEVDESRVTAAVVQVSPLEIRGYKLLERLGAGTMGTVYKAVQLAMDRIVALKILPAAMTSNQNFVARFIQEARAAGKLNHPNLIRIHEVNRSGQYYYYSMEYVEGTDLGSLIEKLEVLPAGRVLRIMGQVVRALDYGHQYGYVHGEIRPPAILVAKRGDRTKLADLGITKIGGRARYLIGKNAYYVAPEQAADGIVDIRTDFYCLGACMFHAVTGEPPFVGKTPQEILGKQITAEVPDPRLINQRVPNGLAATIMRMMAKSPQERFANPAELLRGMRGGGGGR